MTESMPTLWREEVAKMTYQHQMTYRHYPSPDCMWCRLINYNRASAGMSPVGNEPKLESLSETLRRPVWEWRS